MKTTHSKNIEEYCLTAWNSMKANLYRWGNPETDIRSMTRIWYVNIHDSGTDKLNLISEAAIPYRKKSQTTKITWDHYTRPQAQSYMIYDNPEKYLFNYETFRKLFYDARKAVIVTCDENDRASKDSFNDGVNYSIKHKSNELYDSLGIKMYEFSNERYWKDRQFKLVSNDVLPFNAEVLIGEKRFLVV
tara:strand:+ start:183 stop:749 length:567 start_codon:yes stop_codon:yes gene_type:complete